MALSTNERQQMLDVLNCERFADCSPYFIYATLLDEGWYISSVRTLCRALEAECQDLGQKNKGRKLSDTGATARFNHAMAEARLSKIIQVDLKA